MLSLDAGSNWWPTILGLGGFLLALFAGWRGWVALRGDRLKEAQAEAKASRSDVARLLREAGVRIDNEQAYLAEIDTLQNQVTEQRERITRLLDDKSDRKQETKGPDR